MGTKCFEISRVSTGAETDAEDRVHEVTWSRPARAYFGVAFNAKYMMYRFMNQHEKLNRFVGSVLDSGDDDFDLVMGITQDWAA